MPTLGTCPVCERAIRVRTGKMVHHGYRRPGWGQIVGDCFAVGREPYEVSCAATRDYLRVVESHLAFSEAFLGRLRGGEVLTLYHDARVPVPTTDARSGRRDPGWTEWRAPVMSTEEAPERRALWRSVLERRTHETEEVIRVYRGDVERCDRLIRDWRPGELREVPRPERDPTAPRRRRRLFGRRA